MPHIQLSLPHLRRVGIFCWEYPSTTSKDLCPFLFMAETPFHLGKNSDPVKSSMILLKDGTGHQFVLSGITQTVQQSLSKEPQKHLLVDTTARTSISSTGTCFMAPLMRIYALWGGVSSPCPVCLLSPESKWTGHLDVEHGKGGN